MRKWEIHPPTGFLSFLFVQESNIKVWKELVCCGFPGHFLSWNFSQILLLLFMKHCNVIPHTISCLEKLVTMVARNGHSASLSKYQQNVQNTNRPYQNTNLVGIMIIGILTVGILIPTRSHVMCIRSCSVYFIS